jgi:hypothetical protein
VLCYKLIIFLFNFLALPPSRFGEPPLPALPPLPSGDDELFSPPGNGELSPNCCGDVSPTFEKPTYREMEKTMEASRFVAQHVKNKDKFESVSILFLVQLIFHQVVVDSKSQLYNYSYKLWIITIH